ncbi:MAG: hypothetical protein WC753_01780 [Candidatus Gracilibacteria bacterium]
MIDGGPNFVARTVSCIERVRKNGGNLGGEGVTELAHGLSTVYPCLPNNTIIQSATSGFVANVLMGGYGDNPRLGERMGKGIGVLINYHAVLTSCETLGIPSEPVDGVFRRAVLSLIQLPNGDTISPESLA